MREELDKANAEIKKLKFYQEAVDLTLAGVLGEYNKEREINKIFREALMQYREVSVCLAAGDNFVAFEALAKEKELRNAFK